MGVQTHEGRLNVDEGIDLFTATNLLDDPAAAVVIVHGINEHCGRYDHVVSCLNEGGYSVYRFDHRGHGRSDGERGYLEDYQLFIDDTDRIVDMAIKENSGKPIFMLGHSMGGFVSACYGIQHKDRLTGQILTGPPTIILPAVEPLKDFDYKAQGKNMIPNSLTKDVSRDPAVVKAYEEDPLNLKEFTMMLMGELFIRGTKWLIEHTAEYEYPCLILHGGDDKIVPADSSRSFFDTIASKDKTIKVYDGLYHEIMNEPEKDMVLDDIRAWLQKHV